MNATVLSKDWKTLIHVKYIKGKHNPSTNTIS